MADAGDKVFLAKIKPKLVKGDTKTLENELNKSFKGVSKKFGTELKNSLKNAILGGGIASTFLTLASKIMSPFNELDAKINATLSRLDNIDTLSQQLGTTPARLLRLQGVTRAKGIDEQTLIMTLTRFQQEVGKAKLGDESATLKGVRNDRDTVETFYAFLNALSREKDVDKRMTMAGNVLGARPVGKLAELINAGDLESTVAQLRLPSDKAVNQGVATGGAKEERQAILRFNSEVKDLFDANSKITNDTLNAQDEYFRKQNELTNALIPEYRKSAETQMKMLEAQKNIQELVMQLAPVVNGILDAVVGVTQTINEVMGRFHVTRDTTKAYKNQKVLTGTAKEEATKKYMTDRGLDYNKWKTNNGGQ